MEKEGASYSSKENQKLKTENTAKKSDYQNNSLID